MDGRAGTLSVVVLVEDQFSEDSVTVTETTGFCAALVRAMFLVQVRLDGALTVPA